MQKRVEIKDGPTKGRYRLFGLRTLISVAMIACSSCSKDTHNGSVNAGHSDSGDTDVDTDTDADNDTDSDADSDTNSDADGDSDNDSDTDSDSDADSDSDSDSDTDTNFGLPLGCELISPANENFFGWKGMEAMDNDHMVWAWVDTGDDTVLMVRKLSTGEQRELLRSSYPQTVDNPTILGDRAFFERETNKGDASTREVFSIELDAQNEVRLTNNSTADGVIFGGEEDIVYTSHEKTGGAGIKILNLDSGKESVISDDLPVVTLSYNGSRWAVFADVNGPLTKYDLQNPSNGLVELKVDDKILSEHFFSFKKESPELAMGLSIEGETEHFDLIIWNMETDERTVLVKAPWDQGQPDYQGNVVVYSDSQASNASWWSFKKAEIKVVDRETRVIRTVLPLETYYGLSIWGHHVAVNNVGKWGDSIILCDLEQAGIMKDGHVVPESASPDAGLDSGIK